MSAVKVSVVREKCLQALEQRKAWGHYREMRSSRSLHSTSPATVDFASNDYLGLARHLGLKERILQRHQELPANGSTGSRLLTGNFPMSEQVEDKLRRFHRAESCLLMNAGYSANLGLLPCLVGKEDVVIMDELVHASLREGARLAGSQRLNFRHNDLEHLEKRLKSQQLKRTRSQALLVVVESVYSMDGDLAPLEQITTLTERYGAELVVDEAHATGVFGPQGEGLVVELGLQEKVLARVHTLGKALGVHGACIVGPRWLKETLVNFCRPWIYSTGLSPLSVASIEEAYGWLELNQDLRQTLRLRIDQWALNVPAPASSPWRSPIFPWIVGERTKLLSLKRTLDERGVDVNLVMSPTVQQGKERLRICLHAFNTADEVKLLSEVLKETQGAMEKIR